MIDRRRMNMNCNYIDIKQLKNITLLYVEDDNTTRNQIAKNLTVMVKKLYLASNGKEGLEVFKEYKPNVVITDILMPQLDGLSMSKKIRDINPLVPIIITTAFGEANFLLEAINMNIDRYLIKPIDMKKLNETLYRASIVVNQKKEIVERDFIIKNILLSNPTYSLIVNGLTMSKVNEDITQLIGSVFDDDFIFFNQDSQREYCDIKEVLKYMQKNNIKEKNLLLKSKRHIKKKEFLIRIYYFKISELFLITFFERNRVLDNVWEQNSKKININ